MSTFISIQYHKTAYGELIIGVFDNHLCLCDWRYRKMRNSVDDRLQRFLNSPYKEEVHPVIQQCIQQLQEYFSKSRRNFDLPLLLAGSHFQKRVWQALLKIPYGTTSTYLELASNPPIDNPQSIRAVAAANGANAISIIVPCHRVIGSDGKLVGYAGGIPAKQKLLELESSLMLL